MVVKVHNKKKRFILHAPREGEISRLIETMKSVRALALASLLI